MKVQTYRDPGNGLELEYILYRSASPSKALVVAFPGPGGKMRGGEWGYLFTLKQIKDINALFLRTNTEYRKSKMTYRNGQPVIEDAIMGLVRQCEKETGATHLIAIGTSMGGWCALYYGFKYRWDIISGSPGLTFKGRSREDIAYACGNAGEAASRWINGLLESVIRDSIRNGYDKKCFVSWGDGERLWKDPAEGPRLRDILCGAGLQVSIRFYPFSDHQTVCELFPQILSTHLPWYLGMQDAPTDTGSEKASIATDKAAYFEQREAVYKALALPSPAQCMGVAPAPDIRPALHYGDRDRWIALRNYAYIRVGWYWGRGKDVQQPAKVSRHGLWRPAKASNDRYLLDFLFHDTILQHIERTRDDEALEWLSADIAAYFREVKPEENHSKTMRGALARLHFFLDLHRILLEKGIDAGYLPQIPLEIMQFIRFAVVKRNFNVQPVWRLRGVLGLLYVALYFREDAALHDSLLETAVRLLDLFANYCFDASGFCISGQAYYHDAIANELAIVLDFAERHEIGQGKVLSRTQRKCRQILKCAARLSAPDGTLARLGHTPRMARRTAKWIRRTPGNMILRSSNIAILEDAASLSYLTIHGGSNIHSNTRHCDLLSFTWHYDGKNVFCDAGGGMGPMELFAASSIAHTAFLCDNMDYVIPDYRDFTAIDEDIDERADCVIIPASHHLAEGAILSRKFLWIPPNILILLDDGTAGEERRFTQNFLLDDFAADRSDPHRVIVRISEDAQAVITQYDRTGKTSLEEFHGTDSANDEAHFRGSLIDSWTAPRKGLCLAYTKTAKTARFLTSIELHSPGGAGREERVRSVDFDAYGNLVVALESGKTIYEKEQGGTEK